MRTNRDHRRRAGDLGLGAAFVRDWQRPLAEDEAGVAYWVRHARLGVLLSVLSAGGGLGYAFAMRGTPDLHPVTSGLAIATLLATPLLLLLPLPQMMRDHRGRLFFYAWSLVFTAALLLAARFEGGESSPVSVLLFVTLSFAALSFSPAGVVVMGAVMTGSYVTVVASPGITPGAVFVACALIMHALFSATVSANSWAALDRHRKLVGTQRLLAHTDELTSAANRRALLLAVADATAAPDGTTVLCLVDLDGFKGVNDKAGHLAGDRVLKAITAALTVSVRETDTVARLGGDEFAVLAEVTPELPPEILGERLRSAIEAAGAASAVTGSVGVTLIQPGDDFDAVLHRADEGMYRAKAAGGNRVEMCPAAALASTA